MKSNFCRVSLLGAALASSAVHCANAAVNYNELIDTPTEWSVTFSDGPNLQALLNGAGHPTSLSWGLSGSVGESVGAGDVVGSGIDGFSWSGGLRDLSGGPDLNFALSGPYGTPETATITLPHGSAFDTLQISLTVQAGAPLGNPAFHNWGDFTGSWHLTHAVGVPDGGGTMPLLLLVFPLLALLRARLQ